MYLFCDRMMPALTVAGTRGQRCWSTGNVVDTKTLAVRSGVVAVLGLREAGAIAIETYEAKKLMITVRGVRATLLAEPQGLDGLERPLLHFLHKVRHPEHGSDVGDAFKRLTPIAEDPFAAIAQMSADTALKHGYLLRVPNQRGVRGRVLRVPKSHLAADADRIASMKPTFEEFVLRWNASYAANARLHRELERSIQHAIAKHESTETYEIAE
jgi:hypothetical protein